MPSDTLAARLRAARDKTGLSQPALADRAGVPVETLRQIEQGRRPDPRFSTMTLLARALGVSLDELAGG